MNALDSARIAAALADAGHVRVGAEQDGDLVLVNSCTVTAEADRKSLHAVQSALRADKPVCVLGCGPRVDADRWRLRLPGIEVFASEDELLAHLGASAPPLLAPPLSRTRLLLAVQHGCDNTCAYCVPRLARGKHRSVPSADLAGLARGAELDGFREIVLTGINLGAWGCSDTRMAAQTRLHELVWDLLTSTVAVRFRLSSLGPQYIPPPFFDVLAHPRLCDHIHLSAQSGSDRVLARMARGHNCRQVIDVVRAARRVRADIALTADFIVGFPGETESDFDQTLELAAEARFAKLHVFPFSARPGTPAAQMPGQVHGSIRKQRATRLRSLGQQLRDAFLASQHGRWLPLLIEQDGTGLTSNYVRVRAAGLPPGEVHDVRLTAQNIIDTTD
jgi:threonylcarbamoyladenosine tRNA methylthiotransferase MtaB